MVPPNRNWCRMNTENLNRETYVNMSNAKKIIASFMYIFCSRNKWKMKQDSPLHISQPKVLLTKGSTSKLAVTYAERGVLTTADCAINAAGGFIPPMMIFPIVDFKDYMIAGAPSETIGAVMLKKI